MISWNALGMALVHFGWQGVVIALTLFVAMRFTGQARLRHGLAVGALTLMLLSFVVTLATLVPVAQPVQIILALGESSVTGVVGWSQPAGSWKVWLPWLSGVWIVGVLSLAGYRAGGWWVTRKLRQDGICKPSSEWRERMRLLEERIGLSKAALWFESGLIESPMVLGWLRPVLLTPVGMLASMPVSQVESILLHELAHLYRRDPLVNLLQVTVESLLFYHPAVWWVSGVIGGEREKCCDDLVVALQGDAPEYARALLTLEERRATRLEPMLAANGGDLMERIERLAGHREEPRSLGGVIAIVGLLTVLGCLVALGQKPGGPYEMWLKQDVSYIIKDAEKAQYNKLKTDADREKFIVEFWAKRDPSPATPNENEFKEEHYRRIAYSNQKFATKLEGWKTDRGRVYIQYGPPDEIEMHPGRASWLYKSIAGVGERVIIEFKVVDGEYKWTRDPQ